MPHIKQPPHQFMVIEGNIGAGKTTLAQKLAHEYALQLVLEQFETNPFLPKFYENPTRYTFHAEAHFLLDRHRQVKDWITLHHQQQHATVSDYMFDKSLVFAEANLPPDEFELYERLFRALFDELPQPDLLVYLHAPVEKLLQHIKQRGRNYEQSMSPDYLLQIQKTYLQHLQQHRQLPILLIHTQQLDYVNRPDHYQSLLQWIGQKYPCGITEIEF
ncbi:MAG: deoxynucleoside kinase [Chitinophagales bacterium]|nr:deoxynucleoside kinase [Chitinophagales bacterium]